MPKGNCKHDKCEGPAAGKGYCKRHYRAWKLGNLPKARYKICTAEGCKKPRAAGSKCADHVPVSRRAQAEAAAAEKAAKAPAAEPEAAAEPAPTEAASAAPEAAAEGEAGEGN